MLKRLIQRMAHPAFRKLSGEAFWVAFGIFFSTVGTFAGVRLLTSVMTPDEYGKLALGVSVALSLVYSLGLGGGGTMARFYPVAAQDGAAGWYWRAIGRSLIGTVLLAAVLALAVGGGLLLAGSGLLNAAFWSLAMLFGGAWTLHMFAVSLHTGARNRRLVSAHQCVLEWGRFLVAFALAAVWTGRAVVVLAGFFIAVCAALVSEWIWTRKTLLDARSSEPAARDRTPELMHYFYPMVVAGIFFWVQMFVDRWALKSFCSLQEVGVYFALYQISYSPMIHFSNFLCGFLGPVLYGKSGDGSDREQRRQTLVINERTAAVVLGLVLAGFVAALFIGEWICALLVDPGYRAGFWAFPWILLSGGIYAVAQQLILSVYSGTDTRVMVPLRAGSALFSGLFYLLGARWFGFRGVVFGGLYFALFFFVVTVLIHLVCKHRPVPAAKQPAEEL